MRETRRNMQARTSPGQKQGPRLLLRNQDGQLGAKLATGTNRNRQWTRSDNLDLILYTCIFIFIYIDIDIGYRI